MNKLLRIMFILLLAGLWFLYIVKNNTAKEATPTPPEQTETMPLEQTETTWENGKIIVNSIEMTLSRQTCSIDRSIGGRTSLYKLTINLIDTSKERFNNISFSINNQTNKEDLLTIWTHTINEFSNYLQSDTYTKNINASEIDLIWTNVNIINSTFSADGYIKVKTKTIVDLPPQNIYFTCSDAYIM